MSGTFTNRTWQDRGKVAAGDAADLQPPRIQIDVPMGTSYYDIQESIFRQAWRQAGTQLRAAIALGIAPETVSRVLRCSNRKRVGCPQVPEAWPMVMPPGQPPEMNREIGPKPAERFNSPTNGAALRPTGGSSGGGVSSKENQAPDPAISGEFKDRAIDAKMEPLAAPASFKEDPKESDPALDDNNDDP